MSFHYESYSFDTSNYFRFSITPAVRTLILINVLVFVLELIIGVVISILNQYLPINQGDSLSYLLTFPWLGFNIPLFLRGAIWQPITYMFLHSSLTHLFFNMLCLYFFGPEVENYFSRKRFYFFYIFCGLVAVLTNFIPFLIRGSQPPILGASGSIMAVLIAFAYINPEREFFLFPLPIPINARGIVVLVILLNLFYAFGETQYSVLTHFAGMGIGYLYIVADYSGLIFKVKKFFRLNKFHVV
ncbi:MAG TPA: rhomboid family intramembrane serine protease [Candidatus Hydrogenedens sp.]|nr:rhomboid family intramembrane serine protease [Candidatus Hydrogenedens sp.]